MLNLNVKKDGRVVVRGHGIAVRVDGVIILGYTAAERLFGFAPAALSNKATTVAGKLVPFTVNGRSVTHPDAQQVRDYLASLIN